MNFVLNDFQGPLDVLLKLIKDSKIDIYDIPFVLLADQYLDFIENMKDLDLSLASEYLVLASELMYLKSKALVPSSEEDEDFIEAKEDLVNRLVEYQKYKEISKDFHDLEEKRKDVFMKAPTSLKEYNKDFVLSSDITLEDLVNAFKKFMERKSYEEPVNTKITTKEYSVEERTNDIRNRLKKSKRIEFFELFDSYSKPYVVVTFLSILEMAKNDEIRIIQENNFDKIYCEGI